MQMAMLLAAHTAQIAAARAAEMEMLRHQSAVEAAAADTKHNNNHQLPPPTARSPPISDHGSPPQSPPRGDISPTTRIPIVESPRQIKHE